MWLEQLKLKILVITVIIINEELNKCHLINENNGYIAKMS